MLGALLAFNDAQLEREFWQSPPVRNRLLAIDQFITAIVIFNNVIAVLHALEWGSAQQNAGPPTFFFSFLLGGVIYVAMQAAVCWACSRHTDAYYRVRNAVMIVLRLVRILPLFCLSIVSSGPIEDAFAGFLVQRSGSNPVWAISRLILTRSFIVWGFLYQAQFMLPFRLNLLLHCAFAPVLLHAASRLAFTFDHPQLKPTVCRLATRLIILSGARPGGNCPRLAAPVVSYSVSTLFGLLLHVSSCCAASFRTLSVR